MLSLALALGSLGSMIAFILSGNYLSALGCLLAAYCFAWFASEGSKRGG